MKLLQSEAAKGFIETEVSTAELFADLALDARGDLARERYLHIASKARDAAEHFLPRTDFGKIKQKDFDKRLAVVQIKLASLGESAI